MAEQGVTRNRVISELTRSPHGALKDYVPVGQQAARGDQEFTARLIAWGFTNSQIRDFKVALPVVSLSVPEFSDEALVENSLAHMALLNPREFLRAARFANEVRCPGHMRQIDRLAERYVRALEQRWDRWERAAVQHRESLASIYAIFHLRPCDMADRVLLKKQAPVGTIFHAIRNLRHMSPQEAAGTIIERKIPFLIAFGALGEKAKNTDLLLALIKSMTPTELVTNTKMLERAGMSNSAVLKSAYAEGLKRVAAGKANTLKTTRAAQSMEEGGLREKLKEVQEKQLAAMKGIAGNWLVMGDCSGSMAPAIEGARQVAATLAKLVRERVHLVFFNTAPTYVEVTGKSYEEILDRTKYIQAGGGTSVGCGLLAAVERKAEIDGIAVVSDAAENTVPFFADIYQALVTNTGKLVPVYLYRMGHVGGYGDRDLKASMAAKGFDVQEFDLRAGTDHYALPNLITTMRTNRYSLADEIMATPLKTIEEVLPLAEGGAHGKRKLQASGVFI